MLGAGSHGVRAAEIVGLIAAYHGLAKNRSCGTDLRRNLPQCGPHRLSRATSSMGENVQRMPTDEACRQLLGRAFLHQCGIPGGCFAREEWGRWS